MAKNPPDPTELPTGDPIVPPVGDPITPPTRGRGCICAFCECKITADGDVLKMSDTAKNYVTLEDELKSARKDLSDVRATLATTEEKLKALQTPERKSSVRDGLRFGG